MTFKYSLYYFFVFLVLEEGLIQAQDLHYTNYNLSKHYFNPSEAGSFQGTIRLGGVYREQFSTFIQKPYRSTLFFLDSPISHGFQKNHWVGCGLIFYLDQAGDLALQNSGFIGALSYHIGLDRKFINLIEFGFQFGSIGRSINPKNALFQDQFVSGTSKDLGLITDYKDSYKDYSFGTKFKYKLSNYTDFNVGLAVFHLAEPTIRFKDGKIENLIHRRINFNTSYGFNVSNTISLTPAIYFSKYSNIYNTMIQLLMDYRIFENSIDGNKSGSTQKIGIQFGIGYRIQDAIQFLLSGTYNYWQVGLSYDLTVSTASKFDNYYGGFELGINRILSFPKKPKVDSKFYCPRF